MERKERIELGVTAGLIVILVLSWLRGCALMRKRAAGKQVVASAAGGYQPEPSRMPGEPTDAPAVSFAWGRCPFCAKGYSAAQEVSGLALSGIVWDPVSPQAIVNDAIVGVGDRIGDYTVSAIEPAAVALEREGERFRIELK